METKLDEDFYMIKLSKVSIDVDAQTQQVIVRRANGSVITINPDGPIEVTSKLETN